MLYLYYQITKGAQRANGENMKLTKNNIEFVTVTFNDMTKKVIITIKLKDCATTKITYKYNFGESVLLPEYVKEFIMGIHPIIFGSEDMGATSYIYK